MARVGRASAFVSIILASLLQSIHGVTNADDVTGLREFYGSLKSPLLTGWKDSGGDPCGDSWQGITCDISGRNVTQIELPGLDLRGTLGWSSSWDRFEHLTVLDLSNNRLEGTIPYKLPTNVQLLNLQRNHLTRNIPWSLGQLLSLTELRLAHNNLSGPIVDNFTKLRSLITLDLSDNSFTGKIPRSLRNLSKLSFLYLQDNKIEAGLGTLVNLKLQSLDIRANAFNGEEMPTELMDIPSFQFSVDEFNSSFPFDQFNVTLPHRFNLSLPHSPATAPAARPPTSHPPQKAPTSPPQNQTKSPPPGHHKTIAPSPYQANATVGANRQGRESASFFWSPERIAGLTVASTLAVIVSVLTFLYFKWKHLEEEYRKGNSETSWLQLGSL